jgi:hypothetical protein
MTTKNFSTEVFGTDKMSIKCRKDLKFEGLKMHCSKNEKVYWFIILK